MAHWGSWTNRNIQTPHAWACIHEAIIQCRQVTTPEGSIASGDKLHVAMSFTRAKFALLSSAMLDLLISGAVIQLSTNPFCCKKWLGTQVRQNRRVAGVQMLHLVCSPYI